MGGCVGVWLEGGRETVREDAGTEGDRERRMSQRIPAPLQNHQPESDEKRSLHDECQVMLCILSETVIGSVSITAPEFCLKGLAFGSDVYLNTSSSFLFTNYCLIYR